MPDRQGGLKRSKLIPPSPPTSEESDQDGLILERREPEHRRKADPPRKRGRPPGSGKKRERKRQSSGEPPASSETEYVASSSGDDEYSLRPPDRDQDLYPFNQAFDRRNLAVNRSIVSTKTDRASSSTRRKVPVKQPYSDQKKGLSDRYLLPV